MFIFFFGLLQFVCFVEGMLIEIESKLRVVQFRSFNVIRYLPITMKSRIIFLNFFLFEFILEVCERIKNFARAPDEILWFQNFLHPFH